MGVKNDISWSELKQGQNLENRAANPHHQEFPGVPPPPPDPDYFSKILDTILSFTKVRIFLIPLSIAFSNQKF